LFDRIVEKGLVKLALQR